MTPPPDVGSADGSHSSPRSSSAPVFGSRVSGASPGIGAGVSTGKYPPDGFAANYWPRAMIVASQPIPNLAPLLWDAAGLVTESGSSAAHLFESARALRVPAVCGVSLPPGEQIVAVDGQDGIVSTLFTAGTRG